MHMVYVQGRYKLKTPKLSRGPFKLEGMGKGTVIIGRKLRIRSILRHRWASRCAPIFPLWYTKPRSPLARC